ncbi:tetratricopeptide repeat protein [Rhizobium rhizogenes]|uniref:tetratricopeptide repeat protein n=1 Tax=Rhizobium rhizogenes TaxID=359 RepID=UPI0004DA3B6B|nr:hypothetical protein [Rhizobium rhizogenes]KEA09359.1 hypothetical protein CN09_17285 [Rhizobium rhizogenes]MQB35002.1 hypothetical protein [Rhizobium rhizogenes]NTF70713.1 hypothetical protein [Rhizobium rhizogenes]NTI82587.1 hypothetical protein [Rhizobium rhizogenes]NTJ24769.1 hypothetical protein [Rhizobium rhizogenes]
MSAEGCEETACQVTRAEARTELDRLLSDQRFHGTERAKGILQYLAERHFDGEASGAKAYSIAIDVLGRTCNFDASNDPIVRIEVSRLRSALSQYYEAYGEAGVTIDIPTGRYIARFSRCGRGRDDGGDGAAADNETSIDAAPAGILTPQPISPVVVLRRGYIPSAAAAAIAFLALGSLATWYSSQPRFTQKPLVMLTMTAADSRLQGEAGVTRDYLLASLAQFDTLTLSTQQPALARQPARNVYSVELKYYADDDDDRTVWWQVSNASDGDVLKSGIERVSMEGKSADAAKNELVSALSRRLATSRGVINSIEMRDAPRGALGNACVLRAEYVLDDGGRQELAEVSQCLEQTLVRNPSNAEAVATLARVKLAIDPAAVGDALKMANRALSLVPSSDRANVALMMAQFYSGRTEAAIDAGNRALALNPNNPDVSAKLGSVLFTTGFYDSAVSLASEAARSPEGAPRDAVLVLALDAYRRGQWSDASLLAEQVHCSDFIVSALRAASLGQLGSTQAPARLADLRSWDPSFEKDFRTHMTTRQYTPVFAASLQAGLTKAGAHFKPGEMAAN